MKILLFDIDGTLILSGGAGSRALTKAFQKLYGIPNAMDGIDAHGKTDPEIVREIFERKLSIQPSNAQIEEVLREYLNHLEAEVADSEGYKVLPGVKKALDVLSRGSEYLLGLATGNIREGARIKLSRGGLWKYFRFGGFGSDASVRWQIVRKAVERALQMTEFDDPDLILVIGDTPRDIWAAHRAGVKALGVATSKFSVDDLLEAGADAALENLADLQRFLELLEKLSS